eukprot:7383563-Prymnesium_polylepis.1
MSTRGSFSSRAWPEGGHRACQHGADGALAELDWAVVASVLGSSRRSGTGPRPVSAKSNVERAKELSHAYYDRMDDKYTEWDKRVAKTNRKPNSPPHRPARPSPRRSAGTPASDAPQGAVADPPAPAPAATSSRGPSRPRSARAAYGSRAPTYHARPMGAATARTTHDPSRISDAARIPSALRKTPAAEHAAGVPQTATRKEADRHALPPPPRRLLFAWQHPYKLLEGIADGACGWGPRESRLLQRYVDRLNAGSELGGAGVEEARSAILQARRLVDEAQSERAGAGLRPAPTLQQVGLVGPPQTAREHARRHAEAWPGAPPAEPPPPPPEPQPGDAM